MPELFPLSPIIPRDKGSFVIEYTCHSMTINCIDQPKTNRNLTNKKILNCFILNAA